MEITGGTSIVETIPGDVNARSVARGLVSDGYQGCWVLALGTNDTADVYVGSSVSLGQRIREMMSTIGQPAGALGERQDARVHRALLGERHAAVEPGAASGVQPLPEHGAYTTGASAVKDRWFIPDGIHYYSDGYAARAHLIANALGRGLPGQRPARRNRAWFRRRRSRSESPESTEPVSAHSAGLTSYAP